MNASSLNHTYRLVWSEIVNAFVPVAEHVRGRGKKSRAGKALAVALAVGLSTASLAQTGPPANNALPTGGNITHGSGHISQAGNVMTVQQNSNQLIANWSTFNIGKDATVNFAQPSASSQVLNRTSDLNASQIMGRLNANGQVFLLNPNGVVFGNGAQVNVGGLVASTLKLSDTDFLNNQLNFTQGNGAGSITNLGDLKGKVVALIAPRVSNAGQISTTQGSAVLAAGNQVKLDFTGDGLVTVNVEEGAFNALIENKSLIQADGGLVVMHAKTADALLAAVVNNEGTIQARTLDNQSGRILLIGDMENSRGEFGGTLDASAPNGGDGGFIETSAAKVKLQDDLKVTTAAASGKTGEWLIDPTDFTIASSGGDITGAQIATNLQSNNVTIQTGTGTGGNGDIFVNDSISTAADLTAERTLTLKAHRHIIFQQGKSIDATAASNFKKLNVVLWSNFSGGDGSNGNGGAVRFAIDASDNVNQGAAIASTSIKTNGGHLWIGGGSGTDTWSGITVGNGYATGVREQRYSSGIYLNNTSFETAGGNIKLQGKGPTDGSLTSSADAEGNFAGVLSNYRAPFTINSGVGTIEIYGVSQQNSSGAYGNAIYLNGGTVTSAKTSGDAIKMVGDALASNGYGTVNSGINLAGFNSSGAMNVSATGGGNVVLEGTGGNGNNNTFNNGLRIGAQTSVNITAAKGGDIVLRSMRNTGTSKNIQGIFIDAKTTVSTGTNNDDTGTITMSSSTGDIYAEGKLESKGTASFSFDATHKGNLKAWGATTDANFFTATTLNNLSGAISASNASAVDIRNAAASQLGSIDAAGAIRVGVIGSAYDLTLNSGAVITSSATTTDAITLSSGRHFINNAGANAVSTTGGGNARWLVYSKTPADNTFGGLVSGNQARWSTALATSIADTGNRYVFSDAGVITINASGTVTASYGSDPSTLAPGVVVTGVAESAQYGNVFNQAYNMATTWTSFGTVNSSGYLDVKDYTLNANQGLVAQTGVSATYSGSYTLRVTPSLLTANIVGNPSKVYDGTTNAKLQPGSITLLGLANGESFTINKTSANYNSANVADANTVTVNLVTGDFSAGNNTKVSNYTLPTSASGNAAITAKTVQLSATKTYDGSTDLTGQVTIDTGIVGETLTYTGATANDANVATEAKYISAITLANGTNGVASNYQLPTLDSDHAPVNIQAKALTMSGSSAPQRKTYDGSTNAPITLGTLSGFVPGENVTATATGTFDSKDAGTGRTITAVYTLANGQGGLASNYSLADDVFTDRIIDKKILTINGTSVASRAYDGTNVAGFEIGNIDNSGFVGNERVNATAVVTFDSKNAGQRTATAVYTLADGVNGGLANNYSLANTTHSATIDKKVLTVTGSSAANKTYDGNNVAAITVGGLSGFIGDETVSASAAGTFDSKDAGERIATAVYTLTDGDNGGLADNYSLANTTHEAMVDTRPIIATGFAVKDKVFNGNDEAELILTNAGLRNTVDGDDVKLVSPRLGKFENLNIGNGKTVLLAGLELEGTRAYNYRIDGYDPVTGNLLPAPSAAIIALTSPQVAENGTSISAVVPATARENKVSITDNTGIANQAAAVPRVEATTIPTQGGMTLSNTSGSQSAITLQQTGDSVTLNLGGVGANSARSSVAATTPALPIFKVTQRAQTPVETMVKVTDQGNTLSVTSAAISETGLTASAALASVRAVSGSVPSATVKLSQGNGTALDLSVTVTAEGVLVVRLPASSIEGANEKSITLLALTAAKENLGSQTESLRGVLILPAE
jgi:filamentous hemagglutinin family protein